MLRKWGEIANQNKTSIMLPPVRLPPPDHHHVSLSQVRKRKQFSIYANLVILVMLHQHTCLATSKNCAIFKISASLIWILLKTFESLDINTLFTELVYAFKTTAVANYLRDILIYILKTSNSGNIGFPCSENPTSTASSLILPINHEEIIKLK